MTEFKLNPVELSKVERIFSRLETLANISGKNDKKAMIAAQWMEGDGTYNRVLMFLLDTMIVTNLAAKKVKKKVDVELDDYPKTIDELLDFLEDGLAATDLGIAKVQAYMKTVDSQTENLIKLVTKKYRIGATAKSLNEAVGEKVINIFSCQLAQKFEDVIERHQKAADKKSSELLVTATLKLDGFRCLAIVKNGTVRFYSRAGKEQEGLDHIAKDLLVLFSQIENEKGFVFDGELLDKDETWASTASTASSKSKDKSNLKLHVFDGLPLDEFWDGESVLTHSERRHELDKMFLFAEDVEDLSNVEFTPVLLTDTPDECVKELMPWVKENGYEGLMFNIPDSKYVTKRTNNLMKVKEFHTDDLLVKSVFEGEGGFSGMLGGVYVDYKGNDVKVGSGFTELERKKFWKDPSSIVGKVIEVQYFEETTNQKNDNLSLRFPTFKGLRLDKTAADVNYEA